MTNTSPLVPLPILDQAMPPLADDRLGSHMTTGVATTLTVSTNLRCAGCVAKIAPLFDRAPQFTSWHADVSVPQKLLTVTGPGINTEQVSSLLAQAGYQVLATHSPTVAESPSSITTDAPTRTWLATYQPLLLVVGYLVAATLAVEVAHQSFSTMRAMNHFMGGFFVVFSFFKLLDLPGFANTYQGYDLLAHAIPGYALAYPFIELGLGLAYLAHLAPIPVNIVTLFLMLIGTAGVARSLLTGHKIRCACLGTGFNLPMSTVTLIEDLTMALMAAVMLLM
jgi:hypothetical protein